MEVETSRKFMFLGTDNTLKVEWKSIGFKKIFTVMWSIPDFKSLKKDEVVKSPLFTIPSFEILDYFQILMWPGIKPEGLFLPSTDFTTLALVTINKVHINYKLKILPYKLLTGSQNAPNMASGRSLFSHTTANDIEPREILKVKSEINFDGTEIIQKEYIIQYSSIHHYLHDGVLKVQCDITINSKMDSNISRKQFTNKVQLSSHLRDMLKNTDMSDVTITAKNKKIPAHKCILSARSPVFKTMFSCGLKECQENIVDIDDLDEAVVEEMVTYIYTGSSPNLKDLANKLVEAAEKYQLSCLKELCELQLIEDLCLENFCEYSNIAFLFDLKLLQNKCMDFLTKNGVEILKNADFQLVISRLESSNEILKYCLSLINCVNPK